MVVLDFIKFLKNETHPLVWNQALSALSDMKWKLQGTMADTIFKKFVLGLLSPFVLGLEWKIDPKDEYVLNSEKGLLHPRKLPPNNLQEPYSFTPACLGTNPRSKGPSLCLENGCVRTLNDFRY